MALPNHDIADTETGWRARLELGLRAGPERTLLHHRRRFGPLAVQRPFYPEGATCHVYPLHPPAGIVGGDELVLDVALAPASRALLTTPGATRCYRSAGPRAHVDQQARLDTGSCLEWLPQEAILFPGARVRSRLTLDLAADTRLIAWELWCLGRPLNGEAFTTGELDALTVLRRDGEPRLHDRLRVDAGNRRRRSLTAGHPVIGQMLLTPVTDDLAQALKEHDTLGSDAILASTRLDDLLVVRFLGASVAEAQRRFVAIWHAAREAVIGLKPRPPRIWAT